MSGKHPHPTRLGLVADLSHQPRLADAWLAGDQCETAVPGQRVVYKLAQAGRLCSRSTSGVSRAGTAVVRAAAEVWFQDTS